MPMCSLRGAGYARDMSSTAVVLIAVKVSLALTVFAIGLHSREGDATWLLRRPGLLARSLLSINVAVPIIALWLTRAFSLNSAVAVALVAFSLSPVPPILPNQTAKAGGEAAYSIGLLTIVSLAAIVLVPLSVWLLASLFGATFHVSPTRVAPVMLETVLIPLGLGLLIRRLEPAASARATRPVTIVGMLVLVPAFVLVLTSALPAMRDLLGNGTLVVIVLLTAAALLCGHLLGGPDPADRPVLALASAVRHPAIAIAVAQAAAPGDKAVAAAVLLQFVVAGVAGLPYVARTGRRVDR
jgi:bile acid:Na+ symporter, BASS family